MSPIATAKTPAPSTNSDLRIINSVLCGCGASAPQAPKSCSYAVSNSHGKYVALLGDTRALREVGGVRPAGGWSPGRSRDPRGPEALTSDRPRGRRRASPNSDTRGCADALCLLLLCPLRSAVWFRLRSCRTVGCCDGVLTVPRQRAWRCADDDCARRTFVGQVPGLVPRRGSRLGFGYPLRLYSALDSISPADYEVIAHRR